MNITRHWLFGILICISLLLTNCRTAKLSSSSLPPNHYEWQTIQPPKKELRICKIQTQKVTGSSYKKFKVKGIISATPHEAIEALIYRIEHWKEFYTEKEAYFELIENNPDDLLVYSIFKLPFPFRDRSMCERFSIERDSISGNERITWHQEWEKAPLEKGVLRMPTARGTWTFEKMDNYKSLATYEVYTEPGGMLPGWMYNSTVQKGLPKELDDIEKIVNKMKSLKNEH